MVHFNKIPTAVLTFARSTPVPPLNKRASLGLSSCNGNVNYSVVPPSRLPDIEDELSRSVLHLRKSLQTREIDNDFCVSEVNIV